MLPRKNACGCLLVYTLLATGCVTSDFLTANETAKLFEQKGKKDYERCFLSDMVSPAKSAPSTLTSPQIAVTVTDKRPEYTSYAPLAFVFFVPFAHGEVPGIMGSPGVMEKCANYTHVLGLLVAREMQSSGKVARARYDEYGHLSESEFRLRIRIEDFQTDSTIYSYCLGPFCGVPWILALPMGKTGIDAKGSWELLDPAGRRIGNGTFSVNSRETLGLYYSTTQKAYSPDGVIGKSLNEISAGIVGGAIEALPDQPTTTSPSEPAGSSGIK